MPRQFEKPTPTGLRLLEILKDGKPHTGEELFKVLDDPLAEYATVRVHVHYLKRVLHLEGKTITSSRIGGVSTYRLTRHITDDD